MVKRIVILTFFALMHQALFAQLDSLNAAIKYYSVKDYVKAKTAIDAASANPETANLTHTIYMRAFIYKELYRSLESADKKSPAREEAVKAFARLIPLDTAREYPEARQALRNLASTYFNQCGDFFGPDTYKTAILYFENYDKYMHISDPNANTRDLFINFYQSLATDLNKYFESDRKKYLPLMDEIDNSYKKVLSQDTSDAFSWYNLGMLYYNHGVFVINDMDPDKDFFEIDQIQEKALVFFKRALPYLLKSHQLNPNRKETLQALENIYHALFDETNAAIYHAALEKLGK
jgi:hypothetical protein